MKHEMKYLNSFQHFKSTVCAPVYVAENFIANSIKFRNCFLLLFNIINFFTIIWKNKLINSTIILLLILSNFINAYSIEINRELYRKYVSRLGSDEFMGRGTGQDGGYIAAEYLVSQFTAIGLKSPESIEQYLQWVPFHETKVMNGSAIEFISNRDTIIPQFELEFLIHKSGSSSIIPKPVKMVFIGYGIIAPEYDYNDYRNVDVSDKVVVMFSGEPKSDDDSYFYGKLNSKYNQIDVKRQIALSQGARACIIIPNPDEFNFEYWGELLYDYSMPELSLAYSPSEILTVLIQPDIAVKIFAEEKINFALLSELYQKNKIYSFDMKSEFIFKGIFKDRSFKSPNIVGYLEGSDTKLKDTYIIITAHYDHLGIGIPVRKDSIYNGVMDNAMGCAALLEIARIMSLPQNKPKRTVIFMLTTAEEKGLLGSIHYVSNPLFPLYKTIVNINIDGIAFIDNFNSVVGIGANLSDLGTILEETAKENELRVESFPQEFKELESFNRSDQIVFASVGIPAIMIMDGTDYKNIERDFGLSILQKYMNSYYHTPFDDLNLLINYDAAYQHIEILYNFITKVANIDHEPQWKEWTHYYYERIKIQNEKR